jgi:hypothetical protein
MSADQNKAKDDGGPVGVTLMEIDLCSMFYFHISTGSKLLCCVVFAQHFVDIMLHG